MGSFALPRIFDRFLNLGLERTKLQQPEKYQVSTKISTNPSGCLPNFGSPSLPGMPKVLNPCQLGGVAAVEACGTTAGHPGSLPAGRGNFHPGCMMYIDVEVWFSMML